METDHGSDTEDESGVYGDGNKLNGLVGGWVSMYTGEHPELRHER